MLDVAPWQHSKRCVTTLQIFRYTLFCAVKVDVDIYIIYLVILGYEENTSCVEYSRYIEGDRV